MTKIFVHAADSPRPRRKRSPLESLGLWLEFRAAKALNVYAYALDKAAAALRRAAIRLCDDLASKLEK
jgi:hypothetical protein